MSKINNRLIFIDIDLDNEFDNIETKYIIDESKKFIN
jgi:hypothetical protein